MDGEQLRRETQRCVARCTRQLADLQVRLQDWTIKSKDDAETLLADIRKTTEEMLDMQDGISTEIANLPERACTECGRRTHGYLHPTGLCRYCAGTAE